MSLLCPNFCPTESCCGPCDPCSGPFDSCCSNSCVPLKCCKSRELRGSVLIHRCDCTKRNGLQHDCPRSDCQGQSCCMTKPLPNCCPSKFMWRFQYRQMGKPTNQGGPCMINPITGIGCNPCAVKCMGGKRKCPPCPSPPCPSMPCGGGPCTADGPCSPCSPCGPCYPANCCDPCCYPC